MIPRDPAMRKPRLSPPVRRTRRRWRVPPAITHGDEAFQGGEVLEEFQGRLGLILWQSVRDVTLWSDVAREQRGELFREGAEERRRDAVLAEGLEPRVETPLLEISEILGHPHALTEELTARACLQVAQWADDQGATATALAFAQSAAMAIPTDAATAFVVARLARRRAEHARAESWYRRTVALARQSGDWNAYARAFTGLGMLYMNRGNLPASRRFHVRALRAARRHSLHEVAAMASHDLFVVSMATGRLDDAERYARAAYEEYRTGHPRLPALCHDVAYFWMEQGYPARALPIFRALIPHFTSGAEQVVILANITRAAGAVGDRALFEESWTQVMDRIERAESGEGGSEALVELAWGASSLGDWERAEQAASRALEVASDRAEGKIRLAAEAALESARERRATGTTPAPAGASAAGEADALAEELVRSLSQPAISV